MKDEQKELPRLSILENYKQISRIMTASYIKAEDQEKRFRDRRQVKDSEIDFDKDPEYAAFMEEK